MPTFTGTDGPDSLTGSAGDDSIDGLGGDDTLSGLGGADRINGGSGNDVLIGGAGNDSLTGGLGIDTASYATAPAAVNANLVTGRVTGGDGDDTLNGIEQLEGSAFNDLLSGGNASNGVGELDGFESFRGNAGNDTIAGGGGYDQVRYDNSPLAVQVRLGGLDNGLGQALDGFGGIDILSSIEEVRGSRFNDILIGSRSGVYEAFEGLAGNDTINGLGGLDVALYTLSPAAVNVNLASGTASDGWGGSDKLIGIEGVRGSDFNDVLTGNGLDNLLEGGAGNDTLDGGAGTDTASYASAAASVSASLLSNSASGGGGTDTLLSIESLVGSNFNDQLSGNAGDNLLAGGQGNDTLDGGAGTDTADYYLALGAVTVDLAAHSSSGADGVDLLNNFENIRGSYLGDDTLKGDGGANAIDGASGNDSLAGGAGNDTLAGSAGNDTLDGGSGNDLALFTGKLSDYQLAFNPFTGQFTLTDTRPGHDSDQVSAVELFQFADTSRTASQLAAYINDKTAPTVTAFSPANGAVAVAVSSNIVVTFSEAVTLGNGALILRDRSGAVIETFDANSTRVSIAGNTLTVDPTLDLANRSGYWLQLPVGSVVDLAGNAAAGRLGYHFFTIGKGPFLRGTGPAAHVTGGTDDDTLQSDSGDDALDGAAGNDVMDGGDGRDNLLGGSGDDILIGGAGNDSLAGGSGADTYYVDDAGDMVSEVATDDANGTTDTGVLGDVGRSVDLVIASISYTLTSFVENLSLATAAGDLAGTGNSLNNVLTGNEGNNSLNGGLGNDSIDGGDGLDTAVYTGTRAQYSLSTGATVTVRDTRTDAQSEGSDSLTNMERLKFADLQVALDTAATQPGGQAALLVGAVLGNAAVAAQPGLVGTVIGLIDAGYTLESLCALVMALPIWGALANGGNATASNSQIASFLLTNVNHAAPDPATLDAAVASLDNDPAGTFLLDLCSSDANQLQINLVGLAGTGLAFSQS